MSRLSVKAPPAYRSANHSPAAGGATTIVTPRTARIRRPVIRAIASSLVCRSDRQAVGAGQRGGAHAVPSDRFIRMAGSTGLEPATSGLTVQCANQAAPRARGHLPYTGRRRFVHPAAIDDADSSERPAAAPARSTAGRAARGEAAPASAAAVAVATPGREDRLLRPLRERAEIVGEARQREVAATLVPGRRGDLD